MTEKSALITGITGQDGAYLSELLLDKGYTVHGMVRRASVPNTQRIDHLVTDEALKGRFELHYGDLADANSLRHLIDKTEPDEVYNLGAQSHVRVSFDQPEYTVDVTGTAVIRLLEAIRSAMEHGSKPIRYYQAGSSEMFGSASPPQNEQTRFEPRSPYACAKVYAHYQVVNYRESYGLFAANGILFNHESPNRGETFVTRKITRAAVRIAKGLQDKLFLGNLDAKRDWGHAKDYVKGMWMILQHDAADDFVLATNETNTVRKFCDAAFGALNMKLRWEGEGVNEKGIDAESGKTIIEVDPRYFRPTEVDILIGDYTKAKEKLGWEPEFTFETLVEDMVKGDLAALEASNK